MKQKQTIKLNESQLRQMVAKAVNEELNEASTVSAYCSKVYCPYDRGIFSEEDYEQCPELNNLFGPKEDFDIEFRGKMDEYGDVDEVFVSDYGWLDKQIEKLNDVSPELAEKVKKDFVEWSKDICDNEPSQSFEGQEDSPGVDPYRQEKEYRMGLDESKKEMKKQTIKLNESQLRNIIKESIKKVLKEEYVKMKATDKVEQVIAYMLADSLAQGKQIKKVIKVEDLQGVLDETNSSMYYNGKFFNSVEEANLQPRYESFNSGTIYDRGGGRYTYPLVDIVPKGTTIMGGRFVLPK